ncbi:uncharacterized protein CC84DRAFT_1163004 [Paraphaeosphaeria sporulosa]|uniref:Uncharacterized protein n=1 Tax=Paraphaeosphaeria sporulosa TaxID=1460663 RepID=A0A177CH61_9PLEO|nr:uncharacterized protein CC84DRAFT_1163004 [Paraphaeosphaeria sporulosa]OAG06666.1 hypothetical protein CC84DRAFT_1163004 [Paraphaeosphaeria sporulosa]
MSKATTYSSTNVLHAWRFRLRVLRTWGYRIRRRPIIFHVSFLLFLPTYPVSSYDKSTPYLWSCSGFAHRTAGSVGVRLSIRYWHSVLSVVYACACLR